MLIPLQFVSSSNFSVSEQNYQVMVCIFLECKEHFGNKIILICQNFVFVSPALHLFSTEHWRYDNHNLFCDGSYDVRNAH